MNGSLRELMIIAAVVMIIVPWVPLVPKAMPVPARTETTTGCRPPLRLRAAVVRVLVCWTAAAVVIWAATRWHPIRWWRADSSAPVRSWLSEERSASVLLACLTYLVVVVLTNRGLIGLPRYRLLQSRAVELRGHMRNLPEPLQKYLRGRIRHALDNAGCRMGTVVISVPLTSITRATREMNSVEKSLLEHLRTTELDGFARQLAVSLARYASLQPQADEIAACVNDTERRDSHLRGLCISGLSGMADHRDQPTFHEAEKIRVSLWLTVVGLIGLWMTSLQFDHVETMLVGALGGLLGSLAAVLVKHDLSLSSILLSPVAGALNAVGGLLLVSFLAGEKFQILGAVFQPVWDRPGSVISLALGLILGVSGGLFSKLVTAGMGPLVGAVTPVAHQPKKPETAPDAADAATVGTAA